MARPIQTGRNRSRRERRATNGGASSALVAVLIGLLPWIVGAGACASGEVALCRAAASGARRLRR